MAKGEASKRLGRGFVRTLAEDVQTSLLRVEAQDTPVHRREAIRTIFAAIEGITWVYRTHIHSALCELQMMTPLIESALQERSYVVGERGELTEQTRFIPVTSMIRLSVRLAETACPGLKVDFNEVGWVHLKQAIAVRNKLMHPKTEEDLQASRDQLAVAKSGFLWLFNVITTGMEATNERLIQFVEDARSFVKELKNGDPQSLAEYHEAVAEDSERDPSWRLV